MKMPHFLMIGAAKSGTVSLYHYLNQHPDIFMSPVNETNFFALDDLDLDAHFRGPRDREAVDQHCIIRLEDYQNLFSEAAASQILGESSPLYLYCPWVPQRIRYHIPEVKLIAILRQPADRAYSNYRHYHRVGIEPLANFELALAAESGRIDLGWGPWPFWHYQRVGFYAQQLERYYSIFDSSQIFVCLYDDLVKNPDRLMMRIFDFLGADPDSLVDTSTRHNIGGKPKINALHALMTSQSSIIKRLKSLAHPSFRKKFKTLYFSMNIKKGQLNSQTKKRLNDVYREDILHLQTLIQRDLTHWLMM